MRGQVRGFGRHRTISSAALCRQINRGRHCRSEHLAAFPPRLGNGQGRDAEGEMVLISSKRLDRLLEQLAATA